MPSILAVGSIAYDSVRTPFGAAEEILGGSATYFSVAASFFTKVFLVACVGLDFKKEDLVFLESRGIDLAGLKHQQGATFRWSGEYGEDMNVARTLETNLNVLSDFSPTIPEDYRNNEYVFLGNIDPVLQRAVLSQVTRPHLVACDTMNFWIDGSFEALLATLKGVDLLIINDAESRQLSGEPSLPGAARKILDWGPHTLVVKLGEYGAALYQRDEEGLSVFGIPAYPLEEVRDPTGAGDSFAGGFMGYLAGTGRADREAMRQAVVFGAVLASFNVERFSLDRLRDLTFAEVILRYREFEELTDFKRFSVDSLSPPS